MDKLFAKTSERMEKCIASLEGDYAAIRAGRANPAVLNKVNVDYYGTPSPIHSVANVSVPEPRMIQIQPWEASMVKEIEKAILSSDLGINPTNDGKLIRLVFPELTEERRKVVVTGCLKLGNIAVVSKFINRCDKVAAHIRFHAFFLISMHLSAYFVGQRTACDNKDIGCMLFCDIF